MKALPFNLDKLAISFSLVCTLHCLLLPVALVMVPALAASAFGDESFHRWMLLAVLPTSFLALTMGCRQHKNYSVFAVGLPGLAILVLAALYGHDLLGEAGEKIATVVGASLIALGHLQNHALCKKQQCACDNTDNIKGYS